ncbi:uncharacterized protein LOC103701669 [Phoenix dactylifera]|uniref:Uncharacterized protein LOC103701669 n=1 Tax=Phoenix dactylifera TaxID=42345 RepID=A0A8B7BNC0_PHODC|nr:uncharacterized protein LOC103701669 [Phoenix dactylifera]XP_008782045.1 uncharacterized protein LOC103701669 [Phoenix dactylifera]
MEFGEGCRAHAPSRLVAWTSNNRISEEELKELQSRFSEVVEISPERLRRARSAWAPTSVMIRSLGRRVPADWVARELRAQGKLSYDVEVFIMAAGFLTVRFRSQEDRDAALENGPWLVAGQLLAMEQWKANFVLGVNTVSRTVVWIRLPCLPLEYWERESILDIAAAAGRPLAVDYCTAQLQKLGYARVKVEINAITLLKLGTFIQREEQRFWQAFVYENLPAFCFSCARIGHLESSCQFAVEGPIG